MSNIQRVLRQVRMNAPLWFVAHPCALVAFVLWIMSMAWFAGHLPWRAALLGNTAVILLMNAPLLYVYRACERWQARLRHDPHSSV